MQLILNLVIEEQGRCSFSEMSLPDFLDRFANSSSTENISLLEAAIPTDEAHDNLSNYLPGL